MDQREFVCKGTAGMARRYGVLLTLYLDDLDDMFAESRDFGASVLAWHRLRGAAAGVVILSVVAHEQYHPLIADWYAQLHAGDTTLHTVFATVQFQLELVIHADASSRSARSLPRRCNWHKSTQCNTCAYLATSSPGMARW